MYISTVCPWVPGRERNYNLATALIMEILIFSFFDPIVLFYMNIAARQMPGACQPCISIYVISA